ncbi:hypothetical protein Pmani_037528 [Petrolisthes manimaculis]|uniref:Multidrug resistance-associated protein 5 n=2 Tax=Petrolisthes manimaculis TaxID=1843537 RepID=A0AAE1TN79_9EUCA|nr:hypothetical protein Pmani_037528 [Petrolisthes manimaculis]
MTKLNDDDRLPTAEVGETVDTENQDSSDNIGNHTVDTTPVPAQRHRDVQEKRVGFSGAADTPSDRRSETSQGEIDEDIDDALDEGYMGMECTLERGYSLNESAIARDIRLECYDEVAIKYKRNKSFSRYNPSLKHLIPYRKSKREKSEIPVDGAGMFSFMMVSWMSGLMWKAYKKGLKSEDVPLCSKYDMCEYNTDRLEKLWTEELRQKGKDKASMEHVLWRFYQTRLLIGVFVFVIVLFLGFLGPIVFMRHLLIWLSSEEPITVGICWAVGLIVAEFVRLILFCLVWTISYRTGIRLQAACLGLLYRKLMRMSSLGEKSVGEIINIFANDSQRIFDFVVVGPMIIGGPLVAIGGIIYILWLLGPWALFGMVSFLLFYPFQYCLSRMLGYLRCQTVRVTDDRVRMMNELLVCVKLIKMYAWEKSFASTISEIRSRERHLLEKTAGIQSISFALAPTVPVISAIVTFLAHIGAGYNLTTAQALCVVAYFLGQGRASLNLLRFSNRAFVEGGASFTRIKSILVMEEVTPYREKPSQPHIAVSFLNATLAWDAVATQNNYKNNSKLKNGGNVKEGGSSPVDRLLPDEPNPRCTNIALYDLNLTANVGELIGVCGGVGAGKSSLLSAVLGHMRLHKGRVLVQGSCAYVGQQAWVLNDTFRENILLDEAFDAKRYYRVISACNLSEDIEAMPAGDLTEIGERGINLSGGQKQRLSLARAVYANKELYLLDDPLSAVDAHVGHHIFQRVIKAALRGKTIIFVTHQLQYLPQCDSVVYLHEGHMLGSAPHSTLQQQCQEYASLFEVYMDTIKPEDNKVIKKPPQVQRIRQDSIMSTGSGRSSPLNAFSGSTLLYDGIIKDDEGGDGKLMTEELLECGDIPWSTYRTYIMAAGGYLICTLVILSFLLNIGSTAFSSWWLSMWLAAGSGNTTIMVGNETMISTNIADNPDLQYYQTVYGCLILVILATSLVRGFVFMKTTLMASSRMHDQVFMKVFRSPMSYFDTTPSGRIIGIFSRDMDEVDTRVPFLIECLVQNSFLILSSLLFVCLVFPYFLPVLVVLMVVFLYIRKVFRVGIRDLKRLDNVARSPLFSHINTTVNGLATINAYGKQNLFFKRFLVLFDESNCAFYLFNCAMRWLAVRLDLLALLVTSSTAMFSLVLRGSVEASFAGLALAYAGQLGGIFQYSVRLSAETEAKFTSVQRLNNCIKFLVSEAPPVIESNRPDPVWPQYGRITFRNVQMKYRSDTPIILKGVTFAIDSLENIGVVGRTGSGKSSLGVVLFRLVELAAGTIRIDGIDISTLGLDDLRSHLSIIPQDPVLFIGTIRYNLDPFERHTDAELWSALEKTSMKERISSLEAGLSAPVVENGENFSVGERQLLCMARALLRNSKILFLDEATASIDSETDSKIQRTLKESFTNCTMITIAHRLNTVMWCTRVLVMDDGKVVEFDTPAALLANPASVFAQMVAKAQSNSP